MLKYNNLINDISTSLLYLHNFTMLSRWTFVAKNLHVLLKQDGIFVKSTKSFFQQEGIARLQVIVAPLCVNVCCSYDWLNHTYDKINVVLIMTILRVVGCNGIIVHKCASLLWLAWLHLYMIHRQFAYFDGFYYIPTSIGICHS